MTEDIDELDFNFNITEEDTLNNYKHQNNQLRKNLKKIIESYPKSELFNKIISDRCPICLEKYDYNSRIVVTNCMHIFHRGCMDKYLDDLKYNCPKCRYDLEMGVFLYVKLDLKIERSEILE